MGGEQPRRVLADVRHAERVDEAREWHRATCRDRGVQLLRGALRETVERQQLLGGHLEEVGGVGDEARVDQLVDDRLTEALDVHPCA